MLGKWLTHIEYQQQVIAALSTMAATYPYPLLEYQNIISKLYILDLDPLKTLLAPLYSKTGRPSKNQAEIFRSLIMMNDLGYSLDYWIKKLAQNPVLQASCGFSAELPGVASYYDFIHRIINLDDKPCIMLIKRKPSKKHGKGKVPPKHPNIVQRLVEQILNGRRLNLRPERLLQNIFAQVCVQPSINMGLVPRTLSLSGDGTCIRTGASPYGTKICQCRKRGLFNCDCPRRFSDPNATWGWDSHNEQYFYGYTGYFISTYNKDAKLDLPLYLRLVDAKRHDSISAVVALTEFRDLYPQLTVETFISDSASDNYATYELLSKWNINAVIALHRSGAGKRKYPEHLNIDDDGIPICPADRKMLYWGLCRKDRCRLKWRCPRVCRNLPPLPACNSCSPSPYGRVIYTKPNWDLRLFTTIPRGSPLFKAKMRERTAAERINNRILHHYGLECSKTRGKKRISFFASIAAFNIHLDAQLDFLIACGALDFHSIFGLSVAA